jgi:hypothetical protein
VKPRAISAVIVGGQLGACYDRIGQRQSVMHVRGSDAAVDLLGRLDPHALDPNHFSPAAKLVPVGRNPVDFCSTSTKGNRLEDLS